MDNDNTYDILENVNENHKILGYLNEQINFFADLARSRNYIWKKDLEEIFSIQFIFSQIHNKNLFTGEIFFLQFLKKLFQFF